MMHDAVKRATLVVTATERAKRIFEEGSDRGEVLDWRGAMARVTGLEPATSGVTGRRSNQLSYTRPDRVPVRRTASGRGAFLKPGAEPVKQVSAAFAEPGAARRFTLI